MSYCIWPHCLDSTIFQCQLRLTDTQKAFPVLQQLTQDTKRKDALARPHTRAEIAVILGVGAASCHTYLSQWRGWDGDQGVAQATLNCDRV